MKTQSARAVPFNGVQARRGWDERGGLGAQKIAFGQNEGIHSRGAKALTVPAIVMYGVKPGPFRLI